MSRKAAAPQKKKSKSAPRTVEAYLDGFTGATRNALEKLRKDIRATVPLAEEKISYSIPTFFSDGPLVAYAGYDNHCGFYLMSKAIPVAFAKELQKVDVSGTTIRFTVGHPLPAGLVRKLVRARIAGKKSQ
jgi:uncharacterized protein YdhG (YjbR/CyaY superfamily)